MSRKTWKVLSMHYRFKNNERRSLLLSFYFDTKIEKKII